MDEEAVPPPPKESDTEWVNLVTALPEWEMIGLSVLAEAVSVGWLAYSLPSWLVEWPG